MIRWVLFTKDDLTSRVPLDRFITEHELTDEEKRSLLAGDSVTLEDGTNAKLMEVV